MKILFLTPYSPANPTFGGALRIYHVLNQLCKHHDVTVTGFCEPGETGDLERQIPALKNKTHFIDQPYTDIRRKKDFVASLFSSHSHWYWSSQSRQLQETIDRLLAEDRFDVIQCEFPVMAHYRFNSDAIKILDSHNVEYDNFQRMSKINRDPLRKLYYMYEAYKFKREEIEICRQQSAIFTTSKRDQEIFDKDVPAVPKFVIPNGVDLEYFRTTGAEPEKNSLVFVGMMKYVPNYDGISFFLDEIFPLITSAIPDAKIYIIGKNPPASIVNRASKNIIVTGFVEDTRPYVDRASVYVVPLRMGGGTRLKVIEALAMKKAIVTTSIGCEGIDVKNGESVLIGDQPDTFAELVIKLLKNREYSNQLTRNGYELVHQKYGWDTIGRQLEGAYKVLAGSEPDNQQSRENSNQDHQYALDEF